MKNVILIVNFALIYFFTSAGWTTVGIICTILSVVGYLCFREKDISLTIINRQLISTVKNRTITNQDEKDILLSLAFLVIAMKIATGIALYVEGGAIILLGFTILLASGWLFEGRNSGMSVFGAFSIAKLLVKVFSVLTSLYDWIAEKLVRLEFSIYNVEER